MRDGNAGKGGDAEKRGVGEDAGKGGDAMQEKEGKWVMSRRDVLLITH